MDLIIFDCDGTLVDSEVVATRVFTSYWATHGVRVSDEEFKQRFIGKGNRHPDCISIFDKMPDEAMDEGDRLLEEALAKDVQAVVGMKELLSALKTPLSVGSNSKLEYVKTVLKNTGLAPFFGERLFSAEQVPNSKPAPDLFLFISKTLGVEPRNCVVIEDSPAGVQAAQRAGMNVVGFSGAAHFIPSLEERLKETGPTWFCSTTEELKFLLEELSSV